MKTAKEYPATHSMSTSWFGIDKDGNIAIIDFNENGPIPNSIRKDESIESIIEDILPSQITDVMTTLPFSDHQAEHLIKAMKHVDADNPIDLSNIVQIDPAKTDQFISLYNKNTRIDPSRSYVDKLLCLSAKYGIYILDLYEWDQKDISLLYDDGILLKSLEFNLECAENWDKDTARWIFDMDFKNLPFFHYQQPYSPDEPIERTYIPRFPLKATQLERITQQLALKFPFSFETQEQFRISDFFPCHT